MLKIALNQNTCKELDLIDFIQFSKDFNGIEINYEKIMDILLKKSNIRQIIELLDVYDLQTLSIFSLEDFSLCSEKHYKLNILPKLRIMMDYSYKLECNLLIVNPSYFNKSQDLSTLPKWRIINRTRRRLHHLSKMAYKQDINIGFEFLNCPESSVSTLSDAKEIIDDLEEVENLGYVIDLFHLYKSNEDFKQLNDIQDKISLIQLCDVEFSDENDLNSSKESDRIIPGEGNLKLKEMLEFFRKIGYRNMYSIELSEKCCQEKIPQLILKNLKNLTQGQFEFSF